jgi:hypothetical protein
MIGARNARKTSIARSHLSSLAVDSSHLDLVFGVDTGPNWDFRWADPVDGNWVTTIDSMIAAGDIVISGTSSYSVVNENGYTYIEGAYAAVPEPSPLVMTVIAATGVAIAVRWRARRPVRAKVIS